LDDRRVGGWPARAQQAGACAQGPPRIHPSNRRTPEVDPQGKILEEKVKEEKKKDKDD
jgi:hypothetical protein